MNKAKRNTSSSVEYAPLLRRVLAFAVIFVIYSGLIGPRVIRSSVFYRYHFDVYGELGKALLFGLVAFGLLAQHKGQTPKLKGWTPRNIAWLAASALAFTVSWLSFNQLLNGSRSSAVGALVHVALLASLALALAGCFGLANLRLIWRAYHREILLSAAVAAGFFVFLQAVYSLWSVLAAAVLHSVRFLLGLSGLSASIAPPRTLLLSKFGIEIGKYCSGIDSIALFSGLYAVVGLLDWQRFNKQRFLGLFAIGLLILFGLNILRVYVLIVAGYYINPQIAFSLFHTYAGMLFFIIYSAIFWRVTYGWVLAHNKVTGPGVTTS